jgi:HK97 family phage major capsid protein
MIEIGSRDIAALFYSVTKAYRNNLKSAFLMNHGTLTYLAQIVNKKGLALVQWQGPDAFIYGKPGRIAPSMDDIGASNVPVIFGDGAYWLTRNVIPNKDDNVSLIEETPGLAENGQVALRIFCR